MKSTSLANVLPLRNSNSASVPRSIFKSVNNEFISLYFNPTTIDGAFNCHVAIIVAVKVGKTSKIVKSLLERPFFALN